MIIIKGMEMPKKDGLLSINIWPNGSVTIAMDLECKPVARAVELPEHGDLIDRDALLNRIDAYVCGSMDCVFIKNEIIKAMPVIVPAEREDNT